MSRMVLFFVLVLGLGVLAGCDTNEGGEDPPAWLYASIQDEARVAVIDMRTNEVDRIVDLTAYGFTPNAKPHHVAVEPDGAFWYVSLIGDNKVAKFNQDDELIDTADFETPGMLVVHPTQDLLFAGRSMTAVNPPSSIGKIQRSDMSVTEIPVVFPRPHALALDPSGTYVYTASLAENQLITVDVAEEIVEFTPVAGPQQAFVQFAVQPGEEDLYVSGQLTANVSHFNISDPDAPSFVNAIAVNAAPWHPIFSHDGRFLYLGNKQANSVTVIDTEQQTVAAVIEGDGLAQPHGSAISPDGRYVYISNNNLNGTYIAADGSTPGTVVVIDTRTNTIAKVLDLGANVTGLGTQ